jgi:RNA polymerase sigma-70 factor (ECF subfamily)
MWHENDVIRKEERQLVLDCIEGDIAAWETLIGDHRPAIFSLVARLLGPHEAEDATQEVFLRAFRSLASFRGDSRLSTWLYRIAVNLCRDRARHSRRRPVTFSLDEPLLGEGGEVRWYPADVAPTLDEHVQLCELKLRVEQALQNLPEVHRQVLVLHDMQGLPYAEVAEVLGCSLGTVKSRLFYARRKLYRMLQDYMAE